MNQISFPGGNSRPKFGSFGGPTANSGFCRANAVPGFCRANAVPGFCRANAFSGFCRANAVPGGYVGSGRTTGGARCL